MLQRVVCDGYSGRLVLCCLRRLQRRGVVVMLQHVVCNSLQCVVCDGYSVVASWYNMLSAVCNALRRRGSCYNACRQQRVTDVVDSVVTNVSTYSPCSIVKFLVNTRQLGITNVSTCSPWSILFRVPSFPPRRRRNDHGTRDVRVPVSQRHVRLGARYEDVTNDTTCSPWSLWTPTVPTYPTSLNALPTTRHVRLGVSWTLTVPT